MSAPSGQGEILPDEKGQHAAALHIASNRAGTCDLIISPIIIVSVFHAKSFPSAEDVSQEMPNE